MSKKRRNRHKKEGKEPQFDFDEAKELTVGQAIRKNEEVEAGVLRIPFWISMLNNTKMKLRRISL